MRNELLILVGALLAASSALADNVASLTLSDHKFLQAEIHVKANQPTTALLVNDDPSTAVFDSTALKVKKVLVGHSRGAVRWRPLAPGVYPFTEEFHAETAHGIVVAE
jgi:hypothetical protein